MSQPPATRTLKQECDVLFFAFVIAFVACACVLVPLVCVGVGAVSRTASKSEPKPGA